MKKASAYLSLLLVLALLLTSCGVKNTPPAPMDALVVAEDPPFYTKAETDFFARRYADIYHRLVYLLAGIEMSPTEDASTQEQIRARFLPVAMECGIYARELEALLGYADSLLTTVESGEYDLAHFLTGSYRETLLLLGSERGGRLSFSLTNFWLEDRISLCKERYDKYGYDRYLEEYQRLVHLQAELNHTLGAEGFSGAVSLLFFAGSSLPGYTTKNANLSLSDAECLAMLHKQASLLQKEDLSEDDFRILFDLLYAFENATSVLSGQMSSLSAALWRVHMTDLLPTRCGKSAKILEDWYLSVVPLFTEEDIRLIRSGDLSFSLARLLSRDTDSTVLLLTQLEAQLPSNSQEEQSVLISAGRYEDFLAYASTLETINAAELTASAAAFAATGSDDHRTRFEADLERYFFSVCPYICYLFHYENQEVPA